MPPDALGRRADRRWAQLAAERPALTGAIDLQRRTVGRQIQLLAELAALPDQPPRVDEATVLHHLADGLPVLRADIGPLPVDRLVPAMEGVCRDLEAVTGFTAATRVREALAARRVDPARLLALAYQRDESGVRQLAGERALAVDVLWLVADVVVGPVLHLQQRAILREQEPDSPVRDAVARWDQGYCPACGSWPALAEAFAGERLLRCGACAAGWPLTSHRCTYCGARDDGSFRMIAPDRAVPGRTLELCRQCGGYLKGLEAAAPTPFPLLSIEDVGSAELDRAARHHGFRRPPPAALPR